MKHNFIHKIISFILLLALLLPCTEPLGHKPEVIAEAATHTHTDDCYTGTKHTHTGSSSSGGGCYDNYYTSECDGRMTDELFVEYSKTECTEYSYECNVCGSQWVAVTEWEYTKVESEWSGYVHDWERAWCGYSHVTSGERCDCGSYSGHRTNMWYENETTSIAYTCNEIGSAEHRYSYSYNSVCGYDTRVYYLTCGKNDSYYYNEDGTVCSPICNRVVTNLEALAPSQTIIAGETPNMQATTTFLDGHTATVTCSYTGYSDTAYNTEQTVTLSYGEYVGTAKTAGAKSITIKIKINGYFNLSISVEDTNKGTVSGNSGSILCNSSCTVKATAKTGYSFAGWYNGSTKVSDNASYTFSMPANDTTLVAKFTTNSYTLTISSESPDKGSVSGSQGATLYNASCNVVAAANAGYSFTGWYSGSNRVSTSASYTFSMPAQNYELVAKFSINSYTVSFNSVGGTSHSGKTVMYNDTYGDLPTPERTGYIFLGWSYGGKPVTATTLVKTAANHTLTAMWISCGPDSKTVIYDNTYGELPEPQKFGYMFGGWFDSELRGNGYGNQIFATTIVKLALDHTIHANWTPKGMPVSFDSNGGSPCADMTVYYDRRYGYVKDLPVPTLSGSTFAGWYLSEMDNNGYGTEVNNDTRVVSLGNHTLYARWTNDTVSVTITFDPLGGSVTPTSKDVTYGGTYGTLPTPVKEGNTFKGWYRKDGSTKVSVSASSTVNKTTGHTLYADWEPNKTTLIVKSRLNGTESSVMNPTFSLDITDYSVLPVSTSTTNRTAPLTLSNVKIGSGYQIYQAGCTTGYRYTGADIISNTISGATTVYLDYSPKNYTITFDVNGGSLSSYGTNTLSVVWNSFSGYNKGLIPDVKTGYTFKGWYDRPDGGNLVYNTSGICVNVGTYWRDNKWTYDGDITLYAQWTANTYAFEVLAVCKELGSAGQLVVTNHGDKLVNRFGEIVGTFDVSVNSSVTANDALNYHATLSYGDTYLLHDIKAAPGYKISVYSGSLSGSIIGSRSITLLATPEQYNILCNTNGGTMPDGMPTGYQTYYKEAEGNTVGVPTRTGYIFTGWYDTDGNLVYDTNGNCVNGTYWNSGIYSYAGNLNVIAGWSAKPVTFEVQSVYKMSGTETQYTSCMDNIGAVTATFDVYINGVLKKQNVSEYSAILNYDDSYEIRNIMPKAGYNYLGPDQTQQKEGYHVLLETGVLKGDSVVFLSIEPKEYCISYDTQNGEMPQEALTYAKFPVTYHRNSWDTMFLPTRTGYSFLGWYDFDSTILFDADGNKVNGTKYWNGGLWSYADNVTMYAHWKADNYTLTLDANGGTLTGASSYQMTYDTDDNHDLSYCIPVLTGYHFAGWYTLDGETRVYGADGICANDSIYWETNLWKNAGNLTIRAEWKAKQYTVILDGRGATNLPQNSVSQTYDNLGENVLIPQKTGYTFQGYYTGTRGTGTKYYDAEGHSVKVWIEDGCTTLYAYWTQDAIEYPFEDAKPTVVPLPESGVGFSCISSQSSVTLSSQYYDVSDAIPSTENIDITAKVGKYLFDCNLWRVTGIDTLRIYVTVPYIVQFENPDETLTITSVQYATYPVEVPRAYAYWIVDNSVIYTPKSLTVSNDAIVGKTVQVPVSFNNSDLQYSEVIYSEAEHVLSPGGYDSDGVRTISITYPQTVYIITNTGELPTSAELAKTAGIYAKNHAYMNTTQFKVRSDGLIVEGKTILSDNIQSSGEGQSYYQSSIDYLKDNIPLLQYNATATLNQEAKNERYGSEATMTYSVFNTTSTTASKTVCIDNINDVSIHTPVLISPADDTLTHKDVNNDGTYDGNLEITIDEYAEFFTLDLSDVMSGTHISKTGYGIGNYLTTASGKRPFEYLMLYSNVDIYFDINKDTVAVPGAVTGNTDDWYYPKKTPIRFGTDNTGWYMLSTDGVKKYIDIATLRPYVLAIDCTSNFTLTYGVLAINGRFITEPYSYDYKCLFENLIGSTRARPGYNSSPNEHFAYVKQDFNVHYKYVTFRFYDTQEEVARVAEDGTVVVTKQGYEAYFYATQTDDFNGTIEVLPRFSVVDARGNLVSEDILVLYSDYRTGALGGQREYLGFLPQEDVKEKEVLATWLKLGITVPEVSQVWTFGKVSVNQNATARRIVSDAETAALHGVYRLPNKIQVLKKSDIPNTAIGTAEQFIADADIRDAVMQSDTYLPYITEGYLKVELDVRVIQESGDTLLDYGSLPTISLYYILGDTSTDGLYYHYNGLIADGVGMDSDVVPGGSIVRD